ncbi:MAG: DnaJ domain-containing protein [Nitrospiraceae bacterium]
MDQAHNHYVVLGVPHTETLEGIQKAYRRLVKECHPDHAGVQGSERFQVVHEAYEVLSDAGRRKLYDQTLRARTRPLHADAEPLIAPRRPFQRPEPFSMQGPRANGNAQDILLQLIRYEVSEFARVAEYLLSPIGLSAELTEDEEAFIRLYLEQLVEKYGL